MINSTIKNLQKLSIDDTNNWTFDIKFWDFDKNLELNTHLEIKTKVGKNKFLFMILSKIKLKNE